MVDKKITELPSVTGANLADTDVFPVVDVSANTTSKITRAEFFKNVPAIEVTGDVTFGDNDKAIFGAGSDLQIYSTGGNSLIKESGAGDLYIAADNIRLTNGATSEFYARGFLDGAFELYYNNAKKLATTATGIDVTGTVTADGLTVDGAASINSTVNSSSTSNQLTLRGGTGNVVSGDVVGGINFDSFDLGNQNTSASITAVASGSHVSGSTLDTHLNFKTADGATPLSRLNIGYNGDISFYEDTGTTPKFFWDASAESLGIGNAAPTSALEVTGTVYATSAGGVAFKMNSGSAIRSNTTSATHYMDLGTVNFRRGDGANTQAQVNVYGGGYFAGNVGIGTTSPSGQFEVFNVLTVPVTNTTTIANKRGLSIYNNQSGGLLDTTLVYGNGANSYLAFGHHNGTTYAERMRINSAGNVGIGTSSPATTLDVKASNAVVLIDSSGSSSGIHQKSTSGEHRLLMDSAGFRGYDITNLDDTFTYFGGASGYWRFFTNGSERLRITSAGDVGIGTAAPTNPLDVNADSIRVRTAQTPATAGAAGNQGEIAWDDNYIYVCTATNTWKRVAIATW